MQIPGRRSSDQYRRSPTTGIIGQDRNDCAGSHQASQNNEVTLEMSEAIPKSQRRFAGLDRNHVVVVDLNTGHTFGATNSNYSTSSLDMALRNYERWWRGRISNLLIDIPNVRIEVGLYPVAKPESDTASQAVKASVSVGIPDSYIQQVANNRRATSIQQQQATANEVKQNVIELVQGVIPVVPHTTIEEFDVHVARILDLTADKQTTPLHTGQPATKPVAKSSVQLVLFHCHTGEKQQIGYRKSDKQPCTEETQTDSSTLHDIQMKPIITAPI